MSCSRSPSPTSEPPHIGKWFSSYEYASPEMNFGESIVDFVPEDLHRQHNQNMNQMNVDSLSMESEPPDIRNWFSSYVYHSPDSDSVGSLKMSVSGDIHLDQQDNSSKLNSQEEGNNMKHRLICSNENIVEEKDDIADLNEQPSPLESDDTKEICCTDSVSFPSEPPDIRNWYSSYVYESPALFADGELVHSFYEEIQSEKCDISNSFGTGNKTSIHEKNVFSDLTASGTHVDSGTFQIVEEKQTQRTKDSNSSMENIVDRTDPSSLTNITVSDSTVSKCARRLLHGINSIAKCSNYESCSGEKITSANPEIPRIEDPGKNSNSSEESFVLEQVDDSTKRPDKENIQSEVAKYRFISTKKNRRTIPNRNDTYFLQKQQESAVDRCHFDITKKVQGSTIMVGSKRNVMSDVTNMQQHSTEQEISGKWKCPLRSKSNFQPTMKQLRLEQWVTRA